MNTRPAAVAEIDLDSLRFNLRWIRGRVPETTKILAVVKANAYGHGAVPISRELSAQGVDMLGVALVEEGIALRKAGIVSPILVMGGIFEEQTPEIFEYRLTPTVYGLPLARRLSETARKSGRDLPVHIKLDTGMGRLGVRPEDAEAFVLRVNQLGGLKMEGIMTHFSEADLADKSFAREQLSVFLRTCEGLGK
ncbi:MAG: alanine racemase, partial [Nitrospirae bacterium]|nr:alanine racemase [Nitrospirota bacterium]